MSNPIVKENFRKKKWELKQKLLQINNNDNKKIKEFFFFFQTALFHEFLDSIKSIRDRPLPMKELKPFFH
jgi:hypothetical protein